MAEAAFAGYRGSVHIAGADDNGCPIEFQCLHHGRYLLGKILPVGIDGYCIIVPFSSSIGKCLSQCNAFALIYRGPNANRKRERWIYLWCGAGCAIVYNYYVLGVAAYIGNNTFKRTSVAIRGY